MTLAPFARPVPRVRRLPATVLAAALTVTALLPPRAAIADQCYYDSDCPAGTVCRYGACVTPGYQSSTPSSSSTARPNGAAVAVGVGLAVVLIVVGLVLLSQQQTDVPSPRFAPLPEPGQQPPAYGLSVSF